MDKADENSQCLETYDTMRKTTQSEREAKDQITEQITCDISPGSLKSGSWKDRRLRTKC